MLHLFRDLPFYRTCHDMSQSRITQHFSRATSEEAAEQATRGFEEIRRDAIMSRAEKEISTMKKEEKARLLNSERQRQFRKRRQMDEIAAGTRDSSGRKVKVRRNFFVQLRYAYSFLAYAIGGWECVVDGRCS